MYMYLYSCIQSCRGSRAFSCCQSESSRLCSQPTIRSPSAHVSLTRRATARTIATEGVKGGGMLATKTSLPRQNQTTTHYGLRTMHCALCTTYYALRTMYYVLRTTYYVLCTMYYYYYYYYYHLLLPTAATTTTTAAATTTTTTTTISSDGPDPGNPWVAFLAAQA